MIENFQKFDQFDNDGNYVHKNFQFSSKDFFSLTGTIDKDISG